MKILRSKTRNARRALFYNEEKVSEGYASVIGGTINVSGRDYYEMTTDELQLVIQAHNARPDKTESFGKTQKIKFKPEIVKRGNKLAVMMEQFVKIKTTRDVKAFQHLKISLHPDDNAKLTNRTLRKIAEMAMEKMGYANCPFIVYRHKDTDHPHLHIVLSRYDFHGQLVSDSYEGLKTRRIEREIAEAFELTRSQGKLLTERGIRKTQKWEGRRMLKTGEKSQKLYVQCSIIEALQGKPTLRQFVERLERRGVQVAHRETHRGQNVFHGMSYRIKPELRKANLASVGFKFESPDFDQKLYGISFEDWFGFKGNIKGNARQLPEFCPEGTGPTELKPYSFRAGMLGPFFQFERIEKMLSDKDPVTLAKITVRKKEYDKLVPLTAGESKEESSLIMALESRLDIPSAKILQDHPALRNGLEERLGSNHRIFYNSVISKIAAQTAEPLSLLEQYQNLFFSKTKEIANGPTLRVLQMLSTKDYDGLDKYLVSLDKELKKGPDPSVIEIFGIRPSTSRLVAQLDEHFKQRIEEHENYFVLTHDRDPKRSEVRLFEMLAAGDWNAAIRESNSKKQNFSAGYIELLRSLDTIPDSVKEQMFHFKTIQDSVKPSLESLLEKYEKHFEGTTVSNGTRELADAILSANEKRISDIIEEYRFYPDHLKPDTRLLQLFEHGLSKSVVLKLKESFGQLDESQVSSYNATDKLIEQLSKGNALEAWETILENGRGINYNSIISTHIARIADDKNLYHYLLFESTGSSESRPVHSEVVKMMDSGINPHYDQSFALKYETELAALRAENKSSNASSQAPQNQIGKSLEKGKESTSGEEPLPS